MPKAAILTIGDELTSGRIVNSNAAWIAAELRGSGIETPLHVTCNDNIAEIVRYLGICHDAADVAIVTGGLGPTEDDMTHVALASYAGVERHLDADQLEIIKRRFETFGMTMPETNVSQAMLPAGCQVVENRNGTAPGCFVEVEGKLVVTLPGVPREMKPMLSEVVLPELRERYGLSGVMKIRVLKTFGYTESRLGGIVREIPLPHESLRIGYRPTFPEIHLSLTAVAPDDATATQWIEAYEKALRERIGHRIFGADDDELAGIIGGLLRDRGQRIATAESCTGGLVSKLLTDVAGSSDYFERGFVTYTNEAKRELLGVAGSIFAEGGPGAVSKECVLAMAAGARERAGVDVAVSVSGIAGPGGGTPDKPVGTVWFGLATPEGTTARRFRIPGNRTWVRALSAHVALERARRYLVGLPDDDAFFSRASAE